VHVSDCTQTLAAENFNEEILSARESE